MDKEIFSSYEDEKKVVAEIPEENIKLYSINKDNGMYTVLILQLGNRQRYFNWQNVTNETFSPKLMLSDLNKDGVEELIVILTNATGTGVHTEEVHIIDTVAFQDYDAENPIHDIYKNVKTKLSPKEIEISIDDYTIIIDKKHINLEPQQYEQNVCARVPRGTFLGYSQSAPHSFTGCEASPTKRSSEGPVQERRKHETLGEISFNYDNNIY